MAARYWAHGGCRCSAKASSLTGQRKCHPENATMEKVTLTQGEQGRIQVLNSLLAAHMALDQAAALMGVSPRPYSGAAVAHSHRGRKPANATPVAVAADVVLWLASGTQGPTTPISETC